MLIDEKAIALVFWSIFGHSILAYFRLLRADLDRKVSPLNLPLRVVAAATTDLPESCSCDGVGPEWVSVLEVVADPESVALHVLPQTGHQHLDGSRGEGLGHAPL